ncbi:MAG TPA: orotate phosphoribosyltransferase [Verrucomicrobiae bacterium]|nr:orotate phosphoribosyltransferase [Verrucomicrobiae bacterium]
MLTDSMAKSELLALLRKKSVFYGDFLLSSGARSSFYFDCKLTTLDPDGAWLVGQVMHSMIQAEASARNVKVTAVGGLTMGADPLALAVGMYSARIQQKPPLQVFIVRKTPKGHGQAKLIEGNFKPGDQVVVLDDVVTKGESTINAINAVNKEGGKVAFVAVLVDRQEGGRQRIEELGYSVVSAFRRDEIIQEAAKQAQPSNFVAA